MRVTATTCQNPLLQGCGLPPFTDIKPEQVEPAFSHLLAELEKELADLETKNRAYLEWLSRTSRKTDRKT